VYYAVSGKYHIAHIIQKT